MANIKELDFDIIKSMSLEQQQQVYATLSKRANQRMRDIKKAGHHSYASDIAEKYLTDVHKRTTFKQSKKLTGDELKQSLNALEDFFTAKSSSVKGIKLIEQKHDKIFLEEKGIEIKDRKKFYDFLSSNTFATLSKQADSDQIAKDFNSAMADDLSVEQIMEGYREFLENDMTFEEVAERRQKAPTLMK